MEAVSKCQRCGVALRQDDKRPRKYCAECAPVVKREQTKEAMRKARASQPDKPRTETREQKAKYNAQALIDKTLADAEHYQARNEYDDGWYPTNEGKGLYSRKRKAKRG